MGTDTLQEGVSTIPPPLFAVRPVQTPLAGGWGGHPETPPHVTGNSAAYSFLGIL